MLQNVMMMKPITFIPPQDFTINFGSSWVPLLDNVTKLSDNVIFNVSWKTKLNFWVWSSLDDILIMIPYNENISVSTWIIDWKTYYEYIIPEKYFMIYPTIWYSQLWPDSSWNFTLKKITRWTNIAQWYSTSVNSNNKRYWTYFTSQWFDLKQFSNWINISDIVSKWWFVDWNNIFRAKFWFLSCWSWWATVSSITVS